MQDIDALAKIAVDCGYKLHEGIGPGLLESVYEALLAESLKRRGLNVARQVPIAIAYDGITLNEGFRADLMVEGKLIVELKSVEHMMPVHSKQLLTYLRLAKLPVGLLMNFGAATFKEGVKRIANNHIELRRPHHHPLHQIHPKWNVKHWLLIGGVYCSGAAVVCIC